MSTQRATRVLLERLGSADTVLVSLHLALPAPPAWCDGVDQDGHAVLLVGAAALRQVPAGEALLGEVLAQLRDGALPVGVHGVAFKPQASAALAEIWDGAASEVLVWGSRASGKTMLAAASFLGLAELHARAGYPLPLRVNWVHASLVDASGKTGRSLEEPMWGGLWALKDDRRVAVAALGGRELVLVDFVGAQDVSTKERLRAGCHVVGAEELVGTLDEAGGIGEREYEVALTSSMRLEGRRRVAVCTTNPGSVETWAYQRFVGPEHAAHRVAVHVPSRDRLSADQVAAQAEPFRDAPDLRARLAEETWTDLKLGPEVSVGYTPSRHVATEPIWIVPHNPLVIGWDTAPGSHVHAAVICQRNGPRIHVLASFVLGNGGLKQLIEQQVGPWLQVHARWTQGADNARAFLVHVLDPAASAVEGGDADQSAERRLRVSLGGRIRFGQQPWQARLGPLLATLAPHAEVALLIDPGPACDWVRRALAGMWHYDMTRGGTVERDAPAKAERLFADCGDALCYALGELGPSKPRHGKGQPPGPSRTIEIVNAPGLMPDRHRPPGPVKKTTLHNFNF